MSPELKRALKMGLGSEMTNVICLAFVIVVVFIAQQFV